MYWLMRFRWFLMLLSNVKHLRTSSSLLSRRLPSNAERSTIRTSMAGEVKVITRDTLKTQSQVTGLFKLTPVRLSFPNQTVWNTSLFRMDPRRRVLTTSGRLFSTRMSGSLHALWEGLAVNAVSTGRIVMNPSYLVNVECLRFHRLNKSNSG